MTISPEAKEAAEQVANDIDGRSGMDLCQYEDDIVEEMKSEWAKICQSAINSATAPLQKEIERLRGEIDAAWFEARRGYSISDEDLFVTWEASRAKRVAEGKE